MTETDVRYIEEDALPSDHQWAIVQNDGRTIVCVKRSAPPAALATALDVRRRWLAGETFAEVTV